MIGIKHVEDRIGTSHEIGVVRVDVGILDDHEILNHGVSGLETVGQECKHHFVDLLAEVLEPVELWHFYLNYNLSELLKDKLDALKTWVLKALNLLLTEKLKGDLWHKEIWSKTARIPDGCLNISV